MRFGSNNVSIHFGCWLFIDSIVSHSQQPSNSCENSKSVDCSNGLVISESPSNNNYLHVDRVFFCGSTVLHKSTPILKLGTEVVCLRKNSTVKFHNG